MVIIGVIHRIDLKAAGFCFLTMVVVVFTIIYKAVGYNVRWY